MIQSAFYGTNIIPLVGCIYHNTKTNMISAISFILALIDTPKYDSSVSKGHLHSMLLMVHPQTEVSAPALPWALPSRASYL